jgi:phosphatidate cytidylyltransferase
MLKHRLIFGTIMTVLFTALVLLDGWLDGTIFAEKDENMIAGTILAVLLLVLVVPAQLEVANMIRAAGAKPFIIVNIAASAAISLSWYFRQFTIDPLRFHLYYLLAASAAAFFCIFLQQAFKHGTESTIKNTSANFLAIFYLGFLSSFVLAIRVEMGLWQLLMFVFTVKFADIGAYTIGKIFGKHKMVPSISPGKTWEGLLGALIFAIIVSIAFQAALKNMLNLNLIKAVIFGCSFAIIGQLGDLVESMIKRDAQKKDSSTALPGFGGLLDVIDSPLAAAPLAYLFFKLFV